jgi:putative hydrolase of the HAD superfamily
MADLKNKKHLFFDFDDTLWDFKKNSAVVLEQLFAEFALGEKLKTGFNQFLQRYRAINLEMWHKYNSREIDKVHMRNYRFHTVFNDFGYNNYDDNLRVNAQYLSRTPHGKHLKAECIETLQYLNKNYEIHVITNGFKETQFIKINGCGLAGFFGQVIISEEHDIMKPDEKIFRLAEKLTGAKPGECVMIGDTLESDVYGALNAGWDAIYFAEKNEPGYTGMFISSLCELKELF